MKDIFEDNESVVFEAAQRLERRLAEIAAAMNDAPASAHRALDGALKEAMLASQQALAAYQASLAEADEGLKAAMTLRTREFFGEPAPPMPKTETPPSEPIEVDEQREAA